MYLDTVNPGHDPRWPTRPGPPAGVPTAVIELGADRATDAGDGDRPPVRIGHGPTAVLAVVVLLLVCAAGSVPHRPALRQVLRLTADAPDTFSLTGDTLLVVRHPTAGGGLTAYTFDDDRPRWRTEVTPPTAFALRVGAGRILVNQRAEAGRRVRTVALDARTGARLWGHNGRMVPVDGAGTGLAVLDVPSYFGAGRRVEVAVTAVDLGTGREVWTVPVPSSAAVLPVPGTPPRLVMVHDTGRVELRDFADGRVSATAQLPPADYGPDNPTVIGTTMLLRHPTGSGLGVTAYDRDTFAERWRRPEPVEVDAVRGCGPLLCLVGRAGVRAVDPATGAQRWYRPAWRTVEARAGRLLAYGTRASVADLLAMIDPATGAELVDLRQWRAVPAVAEADLLLARVDPEQGSTVLGIVEPAGRAVRVLGPLPPGAGDCRGGQQRLACRSGDGAIIGWTYRLGAPR